MRALVLARTFREYGGTSCNACGKWKRSTSKLAIEADGKVTYLDICSGCWRAGKEAAGRERK